MHKSKKNATHQDKDFGSRLRCVDSTTCTY